ncbi:MAG TPA: hypothetical protein DCF73_15925 [Rhodobiaceae bacterium]|nr:hypothetical protein [Rhodobiaceae bacterium]
MGEVVLLEQRHFQPAQCRVPGRARAGNAAPHDHEVVFGGAHRIQVALHLGEIRYWPRTGKARLAPRSLRVQQGPGRKARLLPAISDIKPLASPRKLQGPEMAVRRGKKAKEGAGGAELAALQASALAIHEARGLAAAEAALSGLAALIAMPRMIWTPDAASPVQDAAAEGFMRRQGWSPAIIAALSEGGVALRMPLNIRCRFEHMPFAISLYDDHRRHRRPYSGEQKEVAEMMRGEGFNAVLVVPVRLPLARVAMLGFAGPQVLEEAEEIAEEAGPQLMVAGHAFTALQDRLA